MAYEGGFQQGLANRVDIPSMKDQLLYYDKRLATERAQAEKQRRADAAARQKAKDDRVKAARDTRKSLMDPSFQATSIYDVNEMGNAISKMAYQGMLDNEFAFQQGNISGDSYDRYMMNANSSVSKAQGVFTKIAELPEKAMALEAKGQGSIINDWHQGTIAKYGKYAKPEFSSEGDLKLTTLSGEDGTLTMDMGQFAGLAEPVIGVGDLKKFINGIADDKGYSEYLFKDKTGKVIDYTLNLGSNKERLGELFDSTVNGYSEYQVIEAAVKMGVTGKEKGKVDVNQDNYLEFATNPDKIKELRAKVKSAMVDDLQNELAYKQGSRVFTPTKGGGKSKISVATVKLKGSQVGDERVVKEGYVNDGRGIEIDYLALGDNQSFQQQLNSSLSEKTFGAGAIGVVSDVRLTRVRLDKETKKYEFEFGYEVAEMDGKSVMESATTEEDKNRMIDQFAEQGTISTKQKTTAKDMISRGDFIGLGNLLRGTTIPKQIDASFTYVPNTLSEQNNILAKVGSKDFPVQSNAEWENTSDKITVGQKLNSISK